MRIYRNRWARLGRDDDKGGDGGAGGGGGKPDDDATKPADDGGDSKPDDTADEPLRPEGVRALLRVKAELEEAKAKLQAAEDAKLSKEDKLAKDNGDLTSKLTTAETLVAKFEIALEKGLSKSQAMRLVGATREELEADAEELVKDLGLDTKAPADRLRKKPAEKLRGGGAPNDEDAEMDPAKLAAAARARSGSGGLRTS